MVIGGDLRKNGVFITGNSNGGSGAASLSAILVLNVGDEAYLDKPEWVPINAEYHHFFASFSGALLQVEV